MPFEASAELAFVFYKATCCSKCLLGSGGKLGLGKNVGAQKKCDKKGFQNIINNVDKNWSCYIKDTKFCMENYLSSSAIHLNYSRVIKFLYK